METSLRLGVVGLGRRWQRYRPALAAMGEAVRVRGVFDANASRAGDEAGRSKCPVVGGVVELIERDDIDAVLLTRGGWMGLWPLLRAASVGKPVFCAVSPITDEGRVSALRESGEDARVHLALWPSLSLLVLAFEGRVAEAIGPPRLIQASWVGSIGAGGDALRSPVALALLDGCIRLIGATPRAISASAVVDRPDMASVTVEFGEGRVAHLLLVESSIRRCRLDVMAERGTASMSLPGRLTWRNAEGRFAHRLPRGVAELAALEGFLSAVEGEEPFADFDSLFCGLDWLRAARTSRAEGRRVDLGAATGVVIWVFSRVFITDIALHYS